MEKNKDRDLLLDKQSQRQNQADYRQSWVEIISQDPELVTHYRIEQ